MRFTKLQGCGNDYLFVDLTGGKTLRDPEECARRISDRRFGVGADGLILIADPPAGGGADLSMSMYNADGSRAEMCGNAALCSARLTHRLGITAPAGVVLETDAGRLECRCVGPDAMAELRFPTAAIPAPIELPLGPGERRAFQGTVGVPHTVLWVDDLETVDVVGRGRELRFAPEFAPAGSNVNFVAPVESSEAFCAIRTYERGVEGETLACGTGAVAAALALARAGLSDLPVRIRSRSGSVFSVSAVLEGGAATDVWLCGEGRLVYTGRLEV